MFTCLVADSDTFRIEEWFFCRFDHVIGDVRARDFETEASR